jgi:hypothetical protein
MTRENKQESATEKRNEYAYWAIPGAAAAVTYSLPLFHEIDFAVNEGYRKIPHGGIEEGGLLFGTIDGKGTRVEAFRPIACEHASGPSFLLSEQDLAQLSAQMESSATDPELAGMEVIGWFLAHTRGPLTLTDREVELCDRYFGHPGMLTVLVKPERFQPTRFGFLVRGADGSLARDGSQNAIILPLPGRNAKAANGPVASIPAPTVNASGGRLAAEPDGAAAMAQDRVGEDPTDGGDSPAGPQSHRGAIPSPPPTTKPATTPQAPANRAARRQRRLNIEQVRPREEAEKDEVFSAEVREAAQDAHPEDEPEAALPAALTRRGGELETVRRGGWPDAASPGGMAMRRSPQDVAESEETLDPYRQMELLNQKRTPSTTARLVMVLPLAALLGCLVGYIAYLQVPSPIIPLSVNPRGENVVVTWPAEQTRSAVYAAVRVDDSTPVMLTPEEKTIGRVEVQARPDLKVELIARNWIHDSRGIVHYVKPVANTAP